MKTIVLSLVCLLLLFGNPLDADAALVNGSFEAGLAGWECTLEPFPTPPDFPFSPPAGSGGPAWTASDSGSITFWESYFPVSPRFSAVDGRRFLILETNGFGEYFHWNYDENNPWRIGSIDAVYTTVRQTVSLKGGDRVSGWAASASEETFMGDMARVAIQGGSGNLLSVPWIAYNGGPMSGQDETGRPLASYSPWTRWEWIAPVSGVYTIALQTGQTCDQYQTYGLFDDLRVDSVPEPGSLLLLGSGLSGMIFFRRKK